MAESKLCRDGNTWNKVNCLQLNDWYHIEFLDLDKNTWNHLTEYKQMSSNSFKNNVTYELFAYKSNMPSRLGL